MYLEISGRQTSKTQRMVGEIKKHLDEYPTNIACVIVPFEPMKIDLMRHFDDEHTKFIGGVAPRLRVGTRIEGRATAANRHKPRLCDLTGGGGGGNCRFFWDEFDHMDIKDVPVVENGYYCATLMRDRTLHNWKNWRNDIFLRLLIANDFAYTSYHGMRHLLKNDQIDNIINHLPPEQLQREFLSGFDDFT